MLAPRAEGSFRIPRARAERSGFRRRARKGERADGALRARELGWMRPRRSGAIPLQFNFLTAVYGRIAWHARAGRAARPHGRELRRRAPRPPGDDRARRAPRGRPRRALVRADVRAAAARILRFRLRAAPPVAPARADR